MHNKEKAVQRITVFQQNGSGERKIAGVRQHAGDDIALDIISIDGELAEIIDDTSAYLPEDIEADLVLDFLTHRDLSHDLSRLCANRGIPVIASGKKLCHAKALTPPT